MLQQFPSFMVDLWLTQGVALQSFLQIAKAILCLSLSLVKLLEMTPNIPIVYNQVVSFRKFIHFPTKN